MTNPVPPSLERFGAELDQAAHRQLATARLPRFTRPRVFAGGTLGIAGIAAVATLALSGSAAAPAFAVSTGSSGAVEVTLNQQSGIVGANAKLASLGDPAITVQMAQGAAPTPGPVSCTGSTAIDVIVGSDGTGVIPAGNTGAGTWHIASCTESTGTGNSGTGADGPIAVPISPAG